MSKKLTDGKLLSEVFKEEMKSETALSKTIFKTPDSSPLRLEETIGMIVEETIVRVVEEPPDHEFEIAEIPAPGPEEFHDDFDLDEPILDDLINAPKAVKPLFPSMPTSISAIVEESKNTSLPLYIGLDDLIAFRKHTNSNTVNTMAMEIIDLKTKLNNMQMEVLKRDAIIIEYQKMNHTKKINQSKLEFHELITRIKKQYGISVESWQINDETGEITFP